MKTYEHLLNPDIWRTKTTRRYHKSTGLMYVLFFCRNALCSKEINKKELDVAAKSWLCFTFQQGQAPS